MLIAAVCLVAPAAYAMCPIDDLNCGVGGTNGGGGDVPGQAVRLSTGGTALGAGSTDLLNNKFGVCRWVDNNSALNYFMPDADSEGWESFVNHAPAGVVLDDCCLSTDVTLTSSDGQSATDTLITGRARASHPLYSDTAEVQFAMSRDDCTTHCDGSVTCNTTEWVETVTRDFVCGGGGWSGGAIQRTAAPAVNAPAYENCSETYSWASVNCTCSESCGGGTQTCTAVCKRSSDNATVANSLCGGDGVIPGQGAACNTNVCPDANGTCGTAHNKSFDRATPPPAATSQTLCSTGTATAPIRLSAIRWQWQCLGADTSATCSATRTGAAVSALTDCRPPGETSPPTAQWRNSGDYWNHSCDAGHKNGGIPSNSYLTPAQFASGGTGGTVDYNCMKTGFPIAIGATTGGSGYNSDNKHHVQFMLIPGHENTSVMDYYEANNVTGCNGCTILDKVMCTDEPDYPAGCAAASNLHWMSIPPAQACEPPTQGNDGSLPAGTYGERKMIYNSEYTCGVLGWYNSGTYSPPEPDGNWSCW
ncbi:MAG: hypothetical protein AB7G06_05680 [Bdellovibrionales bacterium]